MLRSLKPILALPFVVLAACAPSTPDVVEVTRAPALELPPVKSFLTRPGTPVQRSNTQIAQDFLDLSFQMESGKQIPRLSRFQGPIRVSVRPGAPQVLHDELAKLLKRIRTEAQIDIAVAPKGVEGEIIIETISKAALKRELPQAACFISPNVSGWADYKSKRRSSKVDWTKLETRTKATVIIPRNDPPQEIRDCLHEEIAQALGPLNDLYRLSDSVFNDDNFQTVLTGFDMLILKAYYSPELQNRPTRAEAAQVLPNLLRRLNPAGAKRTGAALKPAPQNWTRAINGALSPWHSDTRRANYANQAVKIARREGWTDNRLPYALYVQGRVTLGSAPQTALQSLLQAEELYRGLFGKSIETAHVATQMAAFALAGGQADSAISIVNDAIPATQRSQNAALLATLLMIKAEALDFQGRAAEARIVRLDSLGWGRYGFGAEPNVRARLSEIKALVPARS